jgi:hypothetical protein
MKGLGPKWSLEKLIPSSIVVQNFEIILKDTFQVPVKQFWNDGTF